MKSFTASLLFVISVLLITPACVGAFNEILSWNNTAQAIPVSTKKFDPDEYLKETSPKSTQSVEWYQSEACANIFAYSVITVYVIFGIFVLIWAFRILRGFDNWTRKL